MPEPIVSRPGLWDGASRGLAAMPAGPEDLAFCGLPPGLALGWREVFLKSLGRALGEHRELRLFLESCNRCGACMACCPYFLGTGDPQNLPAARLDLARTAVAGSGPVEEDLLLDWYTYFYQCSLCRNCALVCPLGLDVSQITRLCRQVMAEAGLAPKGVVSAVARYFQSGNTLGLDPEAWIGRCRRTEADLKRRTGQDIKCPVDEYKAQVLLIPAAADLVLGSQTFMGYAKAFHAAGVSWTTSTFALDADNPGLYLGYRHLRLIASRVIQAARELKPVMIMWGESGAGWAVARNFADTLSGPWAQEDYLEVRHPLNILEWTARLTGLGAFEGRFGKEANQDLVVTYHDPCHLARSAGLIRPPRQLIKASCRNVAEMPPGTIGVDTLCCGGGGGLCGPDFTGQRLAAFQPRARALARVVDEEQVNWVATACGECKIALREGAAHYQLPVKVGGVMELMGRALYPGGDAK